MNAATPQGVSLRHVMVVGGTLAQWLKLPADQWAVRLDEWGKVADHVGASWLTVRPFGSRGGPPAASVCTREATVGTCLATAQPDDDGRARLTRVIAGLQQSGTAITEASIDAALNAPALVNPDLVVVVGAKHRMPSSLVWELAYSELVFVDTTWQHFGSGHLDEAIVSYTHRHRRFGGID
ncbi:MAG TPA: undecaprenyl diphosphate synthase family protein [Ilumatobacteraceae bacterium]|nr:undecaprenyl diphosphate synthase family protein [Ilumatobacteraceae bacterium]HRB04048.1 undecaprenyl diphosphate synthase family protein [Ilumatobacteraceae bacterium]